MMIARLIRRVRVVGIAPTLLVLLLTVRVATATAVECQHSLADAARLAALADQGLMIEATELGGGLCVTNEHLATAPQTKAEGETGPHLSTPCPFFKSPALENSCAIDPADRPLAFTPVVTRYENMRVAAGDLPAAYSSRAPPVSALG
ncbi:MAG: hypothetical protein COW54_07145 [Rhodobacteraceae bacterium CG17_big_fil_post_rev_8_21_14_2_50_63_15]|nr:MAG: hypothetical protein COW54_07145 [Rhodobacteraceae bacterium CG17_big_fil_post_rev_8_21_14_2_50_63_15]